MNILNLAVYEAKDIGNSFRNFFFGALMKGLPIGFLCVLGIHYMIVTVFPFSVILRLKRLEYFVL